MWGRPPSAVQPSKARRCTTQQPQCQRSDKRSWRVEQAFRPTSKHARTQGLQPLRSPRRFENLFRPLYKSHYGPSARHPPNPRPHRPTPRPHHNRRWPAPGRSSRSSPLHQPPSLPKPGSHGSSGGHRTSRPPTATPPPPRSSSRPPTRGATVVRTSTAHPSPTPPKRRRRTVRHRRRLRRRPPPEPSPDADHRPGRRNLVRPQRRNSLKRPPQPPPLNWIWSSDIKKDFVIPTPSEAEGRNLLSVPRPRS